MVGCNGRIYVKGNALCQTGLCHHYLALFSFIILFHTLLIVLQALLSGCSAGGLASILHCDEFRGLFSGNTKVKCLSDAGMFLDA